MLGGITKNDVDVLLRYLDRDVGIVSVDGDVSLQSEASDSR